MLSLNEYQQTALSSAIYPREHKIVYPALKLTGEAGEVSEKVGKWIRGDYPMDVTKKAELAKELGDVLWYIAALAKDIGYSLEEIAVLNLGKLRDRRDRGVLQGDGDNR